MATTAEEFKIIAKDKAFADRLIKIDLPPPTQEELQQRIQEIKTICEEQYACIFSNEALNHITDNVQGLNSRSLEKILHLAGARKASQPVFSSHSKIPRSVYNLFYFLSFYWLSPKTSNPQINSKHTISEEDVAWAIKHSKPA